MDDEYKVIETTLREENGWDVKIEKINYTDVHTGNPVTMAEYKCHSCGYTTGTQAVHFNFCPICGNVKRKFPKG